MSQFYNDVEPNIIDDEMVLKAVEKTCPEDLGELAQGENINFKDVTELQLSFKSILQIDNLWRLENLTKLQLDNNVIEKIEALESLVHLVWLDLSFNNIEVIEGLDTLVKLQDLSLYSNRISKIENMDTLQELQIFSIGKNNLTNLENVVYLRRLKSLRTLNLSGNPFCDDKQYMLFVVAHLPNLVYLDFKLVRDTTREDAVSKYQDLTKPLEQEEARALALQEIKQAKQEELEYHGTAFVEHLNGSFLFDSLYEDDTEAAKLASLPGVGDLLQAYRKEFVSVCEKLYNYGLEEYEKREAEVSDFYKKLHEILLASQEESKKAMFDFENRNKQRLDEIHHARSYDVAESKRAECQEDILQLSGTLMTLEALLSNELEEQLQGFKRTIDVIVSTFMENVQEMMGQCRDLENQHHEKLMEVALTTLEKSLKGKLEEDLPADVQTLLVDKNTIVNAVNMSHSIRLRKIDKRESDMLCNTYHWHISVTEKAFQTESDRNRACIKRIMSYINTLQKELDNTKI
ncbi:PREDICTED: dynein regulatory complex subunit 3 isoform X1 [Lepidothrix coronata]|uniref:Dynein regulatory complex subunit 3 n=1 Tax=Lepidothrix coronata TaxID=321398 RepID=A0A6J0HWB5_9PASS|nr:PREDICTED: dynein regulatory complex subunit 3 isoform X1 [Lepidothrix coronata]XP_017678511.1 PREDICTED: dynein regulatory complex subunit 3 isoform X1 [Lepidothrix coronata]XP_017678512.1 PREDICTED: dynein regulatory complex subunit 3 isoform X1 [Lepidothrix coronata]